MRQIALALLALATLPAATALPPDAAARIFRLRATSACMAQRQPDVGPETYRNCGCAVDRIMTGRAPADLPPLDDDGSKGMFDEAYAQCAAGAPAPEPAAATGKPPAGEGDAAAAPVVPAAQERLPDGDLMRWLRDIAPFAWILLALGAGLFALGLRGRRANRRSDDLMGPPRSFDPTGRRPDLPDNRS